MISRNYALAFGTIALCMSSFLTTVVRAETLVFEATTDFPVIDAGEVPYYSEAPGRPSLAIDAAIESNRNQFAKASMTYEGASGYFDITLVTLAELDGEAPYRVLIDDVLVGSAINPEVIVDYTSVRNIFENIVIPQGATISVESLANTNGKIPEGDGTAFARGRWTSLELDSSDAGTIAEDETDLAVDVSIDASRLVVGESSTLVVNIDNGSDSAVATQPLVTLTRPHTQLDIETGPLESCTESGDEIVCHLSEIPAGGSHQMFLVLTALEASSSVPLQVTVTADQTDSYIADNSVTLPLQIDARSDAEGTSTDTIENGGNGLTPDTTMNATESESRSGGGVSVGLLGLLLIATFGLKRRYQWS
ncbi:hypothetical protein [Granulosicoccus antarcticus]|uniref:DUF11 domain-containing protein n=1 Tax=Granulosicoccus antarcticus IMCC3135 TaxID=1192854 RepID=A0A2Z2NV58_9GAMM|nr:hypothetical protein [Granulosicoccus antarcticus]ASJ75209.1 hypothetical protein IMCC3135_25770 [Granulosicoccus antarcticus IMCC3135]